MPVLPMEALPHGHPPCQSAQPRAEPAAKGHIDQVNCFRGDPCLTDTRVPPGHGGEFWALKAAVSQAGKRGRGRAANSPSRALLCTWSYLVLPRAGVALAETASLSGRPVLWPLRPALLTGSVGPPLFKHILPWALQSRR